MFLVFRLVNFADSVHAVQATHDASSKLKKVNDDMEVKDPTDDLNLQHIGNLLPDDEDELLAGIIDDFDPIGLPNQVEELEEYDVFGSGGGMELDSDPIDSITVGMANASITDGHTGNGINQYGLPNGVGTVAGEHPYGEHPSRTLFVRNINSNVEESELRELFKVCFLSFKYVVCYFLGICTILFLPQLIVLCSFFLLRNKTL